MPCPVLTLPTSQPYAAYVHVQSGVGLFTRYSTSVIFESLVTFEDNVGEVSCCVDMHNGS